MAESAGQTVMDLHVHVIPRFRGDMADPRGGVRGVLPAKQNYLPLAPAADPATPDKPPFCGEAPTPSTSPCPGTPSWLAATPPARRNPASS